MLRKGKRGLSHFDVPRDLHVSTGSKYHQLEKLYVYVEFVKNLGSVMLVSQAEKQKHPCCLICQMNQETSKLHRFYCDQKRLQVALFVG